MRELIGKMTTNDPQVTRSIYRSEVVRCCECQKTAPLGIEVITVRNDGESKKVLEHRYYCRAHGFDLETRMQSRSFHREAQRQSDNDAYLRNYSKRR